MPPAAPPSLKLRAETAGDAPASDALFDAAFGPGRFAKTSYRIREVTPAAPELSVLAFEGERLVGAALQHRVRVGEAQGAFLGPFAVAGDRRGVGIGPALINAAAQAAEREGLAFVLLIGPQRYFAPLGFSSAGEAVRVAGPVDPARLLARPLGDTALPEGELRAP